MKKFIQKGLAMLPVLGEILFVIVLGDELRERIMNWRKKKHESSIIQEPVSEEPEEDD